MGDDRPVVLQDDAVAPVRRYRLPHSHSVFSMRREEQSDSDSDSDPDL